MTTEQTAEQPLSEREQLIEDYVDGHRSRGGLVNDEVLAQAGAYADRIAANRAYEAQLSEHAETMRAQQAAASNDVALRARSNRRQLEADYLNRFVGETKITESHRQAARLYADRVLAGSDPSVERRAREQAAQRLASNRAAAEHDIDLLRAWLITQAGSDDRAALREMAKRVRSALDEIDARLFREAIRAPSTLPQGAPQVPAGEAGAAAPARDRPHRSTTKR